MRNVDIFVKIARHVKGVGAMYYGNVDPLAGPCCFIGEGTRIGVVSQFQRENGDYICTTGMSDFFGITYEERRLLSIGDYKTGPECYEVAKSILANHNLAHLLDEEIPV